MISNEKKNTYYDYRSYALKSAKRSRTIRNNTRFHFSKTMADETSPVLHSSSYLFIYCRSYIYRMYLRSQYSFLHARAGRVQRLGSTWPRGAAAIDSPAIVC